MALPLYLPPSGVGGQTSYKFHNYILCDLLFVPRCHVCLPRDNAQAAAASCEPTYLAGGFSSPTPLALHPIVVMCWASLIAELLWERDAGSLDLCLANLIALLSR